MTNDELIEGLVSDGYSRGEAIELLKTIDTTLGGQMPKEVLDSFIETVVDESDFLSEIQVITGLEAEEYEMNTIGLGERLMVKATEGQEPVGTKDVTISPRTLLPQEVIIPFDITNRFLKRNIAKGDADRIINNLFAIQYRNDTLDLGLNGDKNSVGDFITITDGWFAKAMADVDAHNGGTFDDVLSPSQVFQAMLDPDNAEGLPAKWLDEDELVYIVSPSYYFKYHNELKERNTQLGDLLTIGKQPLKFNGIDVKKLSKMPSDKIGLTWKRNLHLGIGQEMKVEREYKPRKRVTEFTITGYLDYNYAISDMMVVYNKV